MFSDMTAAVDIDNVLRDQLDEIVHIVRESRADASLGPVVVDVLYTIDRDWSGDDAVHFTVVTRDPPGRDFYDWIELEPIAEQLHELVRQRGIARLLRPDSIVLPHVSGEKITQDAFPGSWRDREQWPDRWPRQGDRSISWVRSPERFAGRR